MQSGELIGICFETAKHGIVLSITRVGGIGCVEGNVGCVTVGVERDYGVASSVLVVQVRGERRSIKVDSDVVWFLYCLIS